MKISTQNNLNRRDVTFGLGLSVAFGALAQPAFAVSQGAAEILVNKLVATINKVIASGKSEKVMIRDFEKIFIKYADVRYLASYALGVDGRRATAAQKKQFQKTFQAYIARKYGKQFRKFIGGKLEVKSAKTVKSHVEVKTMAHLKGQAPFDVTFFVSDKTGNPVFYNMYIEGINMLLSERTEIGAILDKNGGSIDKMIKRLKRIG